jgi:hypothetical protein
MTHRTRHVGAGIPSSRHPDFSDCKAPSTPARAAWEKDRDSDGRWMICSGPDTTICRGIKSEADADLIVALHRAHVAGAPLTPKGGT